MYKSVFWLQNYDQCFYVNGHTNNKRHSRRGGRGEVTTASPNDTKGREGSKKVSRDNLRPFFERIITKTLQKGEGRGYQIISPNVTRRRGAENHPKNCHVFFEWPINAACVSKVCLGRPSKLACK